ncbi:MAG: aminoacyl-tRNA hydrolase, partial [Clostridia bacterium]|nr:aminoacyl-tRNA hydrolase [Clostridia bacterium]
MIFFRRSTPVSGPPEFIIAGLGNPGAKYEATRHNTGFIFIDMLADKYGVRLNKIKFKAVCETAEINSHKCLLLKPQTFMNNSGQSIREAADFYKIPPERIIVVFDDISLECGRLRIRRKGTDGGHNGIKSIIYHLNSDSFPRIKLGVGMKPDPDYDLADWVLSSFTKDELVKMRQAAENAVLAAELMVSGETDL